MSFSPDETPAQLWEEHVTLAGLFLGTVAFGVHLTLFIQCASALYMRKEGRRNRELLVFICILFLTGNTANATNILLAQKTFIDNREYPGGPDAWYIRQSSDWTAVVANCMGLVNNWLQDGMMLYRFWAIWSGNFYMIILPALGYATSAVLSFLLIAELSQPHNTIWTKVTVNLAIPYFSISISMTIILTILIAGRLLLMRYRLRKLLGNGTNTPYVTVTAMVVETAAIYSINGLIFLVSYAFNSPVQRLSLPVLVQTQCIAPILIILRVTQGHAWSADTMANLTTLRFDVPETRPASASAALDIGTAESERKTFDGRENMESHTDSETEAQFRVVPVY